MKRNFMYSCEAVILRQSVRGPGRVAATAGFGETEKEVQLTERRACANPEQRTATVEGG